MRKPTYFVSEYEKFFADAAEAQLRELWDQYQRTETAIHQITFMAFVQLNGIRAWKTTTDTIAHTTDVCLN